MVVAHPEYEWFAPIEEPLVYNWDDSWYSYVVYPQ